MTTAPTLMDALHNANLLVGVLEGLGHLDNEGMEANACTALMEVALERARTLANDLDRLNALSREAA